MLWKADQNRIDILGLASISGPLFFLLSSYSRIEFRGITYFYNRKKRRIKHDWFCNYDRSYYYRIRLRMDLRQNYGSEKRKGGNKMTYLVIGLIGLGFIKLVEFSDKLDKKIETKFTKEA